MLLYGSFFSREIIASYQSAPGHEFHLVLERFIPKCEVFTHVGFLWPRQQRAASDCPESRAESSTRLISSEVMNTSTHCQPSQRRMAEQGSTTALLFYQIPPHPNPTVRPPAYPLCCAATVMPHPAHLTLMDQYASTNSFYARGR